MSKMDKLRQGYVPVKFLLQRLEEEEEILELTLRGPDQQLRRRVVFTQRCKPPEHHPGIPPWCAVPGRSAEFNVKLTLGSKQKALMCWSTDAPPYQTMPEPTRIVLLGKTGAGKSSLGNMLLGGRKFKVGHTFDSETKVCEKQTKCVRGRDITVIDTPGFFDTKRSDKDSRPAIVKCITESSPGPHAFLIVLKYERFTDQEQEVIRKITESFSEDVFRFATVVFTHGGDLPEGHTIRTCVEQHKILKDLIDKCGGRCHVVDAKHWEDCKHVKYRNNKFQLEEIFKSIDETVQRNKGKYYTNEMLQEVEKLIQMEAQKISKCSRNMSETEVRERANGKAYQMLIQATGIATGALVGAFFGVLVLGGVAVLFVKKVVDTVRCLSAGTTAAAAAAESAAPAAACEVGAGAAAAGVITGTAAAAGAVFGGYLGYQAAKDAKSPLEAATEAGKAVWRLGWDMHEKAQEFIKIYEPK